MPDETTENTEPVENPETPETPLFLSMLKADLQRTGNFPGDDAYLQSLIDAAIGTLARQGVNDDGSADYAAIVVGTAAWIYRKRVTGEKEPNYLRRMRIDYILSAR